MSTQRHPKHQNLHIFRTPNGKSDKWYCGFHHKGQFIRSSTRTTVWLAALDAAEVWYLDKQYEIRHGATVGGGKPFDAIANKMLARMKAEGRSPAYRKVLTNYLRHGGYVHMFFGGMAVRKITSRTWDDFRQWLAKRRDDCGLPRYSEKSVIQLKNAVRLVLIQAYIERWIDDVPRFIDPLRSKRVDHRPRVYFTPSEYFRLLEACRANIARHRKRPTRWVADVEELYDYVVFVTNTGLRVSESRSLRICDVRLINTMIDGRLVEVCEVTITGGKRGAHPATLSKPAAAAAFRRILARRRIAVPTTCNERLFLRHHQDGFQKVLIRSALYVDGYGRKRDFVSLRHSHICFRLMNEEPIFSIARATRTSPLMIDAHYAKSLSAQAEPFDPNVWLWH